MTKRIAYLGLSTPLTYDYAHHGSAGSGKPNPILEAPLGLFLLYDELWFLHPDLCPINMRELDYVKFISDQEDINDYFEQINNISEEQLVSKNIDRSQIPNEQSPGSSLRRPAKAEAPGWQKLANHIAPFGKHYNHGVDLIGPYLPTTSYSNFLADYFISHSLDADVDYISNSIINKKVSFKKISNVETGDSLYPTERIIADRVQNYQTPIGPYFEQIDDFRNIETIKHFRSKMKNKEDISDIDGVNKSFDQIRNKMTIANTSKYNIYESLISFIVDCVPLASEFIGPAISGLDLTQSLRRRKNYGWVNFLAQVEEKSDESNE